MSEKVKIHEPVSIGIPLPTGTTKLGEGLRVSNGHPIANWSPNTHTIIGRNMLGTMRVFAMRPLAASQSKRKFRLSNFKKLVDKFDGTKDPYNHMARI